MLFGDKSHERHNIRKENREFWNEGGLTISNRKEDSLRGDMWTESWRRWEGVKSNKHLEEKDF